MQPSVSHVESTHLILTAPFADSSPITLSAEWLWDNRLSSRDAHSGQRLHCVSSFPASLRLVSAAIVPLVHPPLPPAANFVLLGRYCSTPAEATPTLVVSFGTNDDQPLPLTEGHVSLAVVEEAYQRGLAQQQQPLPPPPTSLAHLLVHCWPASSSFSSPAPAATLRDRHACLRATGLLHLPSPAPHCTPLQVLADARQLGLVLETNYGLHFEVRAEAAPSNLAFTSLPLGLHTDNPYRSPVPGYQALSCLVQASSGGETLFVDGWAVACALEGEDPALLQALLTTPLTFRYADAASQMGATRCILGCSGPGGAVEVSFNDRSQVAPALGGSLQAMQLLYRALRRFEQLCQEGGRLRRVLLAPGDSVVWDNGRVLHGRAPFEGQRHLQGCYLTQDSVRSNAAVALDREGLL